MKRLKSTHPMLRKIEKLEDAANELGLSLSFSGNLEITSKEDDLTVRIIYEGEDSWSNGATSFPIPLEYKAILPEE